MRYSLKQIQCRPWTLSYLSVKLIESHYENNYGGELRRLNAITERLESLDYASAPAQCSERAQARGAGRAQLDAAARALFREHGRRRPADEGHDRDPQSRTSTLPSTRRRSRAEYRSSRSTCMSMRTTSTSAPNAKAYVDTFMRNLHWPALEVRYEDAAKVPGPRVLEQPEFGDIPGIGVEEVREMMAAGKPLQVIDVRPRPLSRACRTSRRVPSGATPSSFSNGWVSCRNQNRSSCTARMAFTSAARPRSSCARPASTRST
jgi:superoxide dismutase, Fe-Mn family